ncbi:MAG TPA: gephyrin-like molybdotransferase Glp, partial [Gemmataceae bacterium]|nr:gephyrin-like molybdotransferase Glp [Gemmataceae bacterium]
SDLDMPPFDKAMMDGYAVRSADLSSGPAVLGVVEEITAGKTPTVALGPGKASRIMTGAPTPRGADAVVMIERCEVTGTDKVRVPGPVAAGTNVAPRGRELTTGETVLRAGHLLRAQEVGLLALVGWPTVRVHPLPEVAVLSTGDELVGVDAKPGPGQIRNSNGPMLLAQVANAGGRPRDLGIATDNIDSLRTRIMDGLRSPVLLLSGGVSAGKLDLVPDVLRGLGVEAHFHKIRIKPGKPLFFGTHRDTLVFGLPGNPVSSFVCFELFVRPALRQLRGFSAAPPAFVPLPLASEFTYDTDRPTYHPARVEQDAVSEQVQVVPWLGSPDLRALTAAYALVLLSEGRHTYAAGQSLPVLRLDLGL